MSSLPSFAKELTISISTQTSESRLASELKSLDLRVDGPDLLLRLTGPHADLLRELAEQSGAQLNLRGDVIQIAGEPDDAEVAYRFLSGALALLSQGIEVGVSDVAHSVRNLRKDPRESLAHLLDQVILVTTRKKPIAPKTPAQRAYLRAIKSHDLTFGIGPAGTGKTYLAMAMAAVAFTQKKVKRIVLTRPAVEAGERLGFLPGDLAEKVNPYLRPLYDALNDMLDYEKIQQMRSRGEIEVAPLAFMRGRTLNDSFVILDEAQNATTDQMKMFLTRIGYGTTAVVTGDVTQTDLPRGARSGLKQAREILRNVSGIAFSEFTDVDVVRHPLVQKIVVAYDRHEAQMESERAAQASAERAGSGGNDAAPSSSEGATELGAPDAPQAGD